jgi:hypothetical protein
VTNAIREWKDGRQLHEERVAKSIHKEQAIQVQMFRLQLGRDYAFETHLNEMISVRL